MIENVKVTLFNTVGDLLKKLIVLGFGIAEGFSSLLIKIHGEVAEKNRADYWR